jgi:hypothetical protein
LISGGLQVTAPRFQVMNLLLGVLVEVQPSEKKIEKELFLSTMGRNVENTPSKLVVNK